MKRRTLLILALSLLLVVPAVIAAASSGFDTVGTTTANQVQEQAQDRDCGECGYDSTTAERDQIRGRDQDRTNAPDVDRAEVQAQKQLRIHDPASGEVGEQAQIREREQVRDETNCDGDGLQLREQVRTEAQREMKLAEPQGEQKGYGPGAETGKGPIHEGPADGTGNQFGPGPGTGDGPLHEGPADGTGNQFGQGGR